MESNRERSYHRRRKTPTIDLPCKPLGRGFRSRFAAISSAVFVIACCFWPNDHSAPLRSNSNAGQTRSQGVHQTDEAGVRNIEVDEKLLPNFQRINPQIYCGGQPAGNAAFSMLRRLGIRTIVSVDGARPAIESARDHAMRYVPYPNGLRWHSTASWPFIGSVDA